MRPFAIAGLQLKVSGRRSNLAHLCDRIEMLMHLYPWVQMVMLSELATFGGWTGHAAELPNEVEATYRELAARHRIWLIPGSLYEKTPQGIYNTSPVIDPQGNVIARYRKMFPFLPYETGVLSGSEFCVFDVPEVGRFGLSICYDMWFPETSRTLAAMGAEVILHPTLTPTIDRDVELAIVRATAATNQCFVLDINGVGDGGNGRSNLVAPTGDVLFQAGGSEEMLPIEIDLDRVRRSREVGLKGLGQPLKSFRDRAVDFSVYDRSTTAAAYLNTLGPLEKMTRNSKAGLGFGTHLVPSAPPILPPPPSPQTPPSAAILPAPIPPAAPAPAPAPYPPADPAATPPDYGNGGVPA
ncbi:MAG: carbon-nitrogen hydrolase family protein [Phycisphaerales bacterium]